MNFYLYYPFLKILSCGVPLEILRFTKLTEEGHLCLGNQLCSEQMEMCSGTVRCLCLLIKRFPFYVAVWLCVSLSLSLSLPILISLVRTLSFMLSLPLSVTGSALLSIPSPFHYICLFDLLKSPYCPFLLFSPSLCLGRLFLARLPLTDPPSSVLIFLCDLLLSQVTNHIVMCLQIVLSD